MILNRMAYDLKGTTNPLYNLFFLKSGCGCKMVIHIHFC